MSALNTNLDHAVTIVLPEGDGTSVAPEVGSSHNGLRISAIVGPDDSHVDGEQPDVDIIHVKGAAPDRGRLELDSIISSQFKSRRRETMFQLDIASLLTGDFSMNAIDCQARQLLDGLCHFRSFDAGENSSGRAIVFVAYDLGSLVVKKAISLASINGTVWPNVFSNTARFIFHGCFQRATNITVLESGIAQFLHDNKSDTWAKYLGPTSITSVARAVLETTGIFLSSRTTLLSRVISLYASGQPGKRIHPVFGYFTATLGLGAELPVKEQDDPSFPDLADKICFQINKWVPHPVWVPYEQTLVSLALPHRQSSLRSMDSVHPILDSQEHKSWVKTTGIRVLHIDGGDEQTRREAAEQVFLSWQSKQRDRKEYWAKAFSFTFSTQDPFRDTIDDMIVSLLLQAAPRYDSSSSETDDYFLFRDQFAVQEGWTETDLLKMFIHRSNRFLGTGTLIVLQNVNQCRPDSLAAFWRTLALLGADSEFSLKFVVTSDEGGVLLHELGSGVAVDTYNLPLIEVPDNTVNDDYIDKLITRFSLNGHGLDHMKRALQTLKNLDRKQAEQVLSIVEGRTQWPSAPSAQNLFLFCSVLENISQSNTPTTILDRILRDDADSEGFRWLLGWLLCAHRPLTRSELGMVYFHHRSGSLVTPSLIELHHSKLAIEDRLRGIADFSHDQVSIKDEIRALLKPGSDYIWNEVKASAPQRIMDYLIKYLSVRDTEGRLTSLYQSHQDQVEKHGQPFIAPMIPDGQDIIYYAIKYLPQHLSHHTAYVEKLSQPLVSRTGQLASWAKAYWAMRNPFVRTLEKPQSNACETLLKSGELSPGVQESLTKYCDRLSSPDTQEDEIERFGVPLGRFVDALRLGNEESALRDVSSLIAIFRDEVVMNNGPSRVTEVASENVPKGPEEDMPVETSRLQTKQPLEPDVNSTTYRLQWALWRAVFLNLKQLARVLLENGVNPNAPDVKCKCTNPLHRAIGMGHEAIAFELVKHGADVLALSNGINTLYSAAACGHVEIVKLLMDEDSSLIKSTTFPPLHGACYWGAWKAVETLLDLKVDTDISFNDWKPVSTAAQQGHLKILKALLKEQPDLNTYGSGYLNPLYIGAASTGNIEVVRILLDHGADPNAETISPPLAVEILRSSIPEQDRLLILQLLYSHDPPLKLNVPDENNGITPLICAAANNELTLLRWLLEQGADVNAVTNEGWTALFYSANEGNTEAVRELLRFKPSCDIKISTGETLTQVVVAKEAILDLLLDADPGLDLEFSNDTGQTALNCAVVQNQPAAIKKLLARKADIHHRDVLGWSPIMDAVGYISNVDVTRLLIEAGANLKDALSDGRCILHLAIMEPVILRAVLEFRKQIDLEQRNEIQQTALSYGILNSAPMESLQLLVRAGADINTQSVGGVSPLMCCSYVGDFADLLLSQPEILVDLTSKGNGSALHIAAGYQVLSFVSKLLEHGADPNQRCELGTRDTPFMWALIPRDIPGQDKEGADFKKDRGELITKTVRALVAGGAKISPDTSHLHGRALPGHFSAACLAATVETIEYLLDEGASVTETGILKTLPIHLSAYNGLRNFEAVARAYRGDLLAADIGGRNALHWAASYGHVKTIKFILDKVCTSAAERKRCVNVPDVDGWTPLAWATRAARLGWACDMQSEPRDVAQTIKYLLGEGSDPNVQFRIGQDDDAEVYTPLQMAKLCDLPGDVLEILRDAQRDVSRDEMPAEVTPPKKYIQWDGTCDICTSSVYGFAYKCQNCINFDACKKCYGRIQTYHGHLKTKDGEPHTFEIRAELEKEFQDPPEPEVVEEPSVEEEQNGVADEAVNGGGVESETATSDASEDSFDDGSDLDDLDKLEADDGSD